MAARASAIHQIASPFPAFFGCVRLPMVVHGVLSTRLAVLLGCHAVAVAALSLTCVFAFCRSRAAFPQPSSFVVSPTMTRAIVAVAVVACIAALIAPAGTLPCVPGCLQRLTCGSRMAVQRLAARAWIPPLPCSVRPTSPLATASAPTSARASMLCVCASRRRAAASLCCMTWRSSAPPLAATPPPAPASRLMWLWSTRRRRRAWIPPLVCSATPTFHRATASAPTSASASMPCVSATRRRAAALL